MGTRGGAGSSATSGIVAFDNAEARTTHLRHDDQHSATLPESASEIVQPICQMSDKT